MGLSTPLSPLRSATRRTPYVLLAALALGAAGCDQDDDPLVLDDSSSSAALYFRLSDFLGDVPCGAAPGAMRSYVVTLVDRTASDVCGDGVCVPPETAATCAPDCGDGAACGDGACSASDESAESCPADCDPSLLLPPFTLPSSLPVSCSQGVRFDNVVGDHVYSVQIDGYEAFAGEIGPPGWYDPDARFRARRSGLRQMVDAAGKPVAPRWLGSCGEGEQPRALVAETGTSQVLVCDPLLDTGGPGVTGVEVVPQAALGALRCAQEAAAGEPSVATFDIRPETGAGNVIGIPCGSEPFVQLYSGSDLVPGAVVRYHVAAHAGDDAVADWGTTCEAAVEAGLTVRAACPPLSDKGSIRVDMKAVLEAAGSACGSDFSSYHLALTGGAETVSKHDLPCEDVLSLGGLSPGDYELELVVQPDGGPELFSATCAAKVEPGRTTSPDCAVQ